MVEIPVVQVEKAKFEALKKDSEYLQLIREASELVEEAHQAYVYAKDKSLEKKKTHDTLTAELHRLIEDGPPKPDPQGKLPFAAEDEADALVPPVVDRSRGEVVGTSDLEVDDWDEPAEKEATVPAEIAALDLTQRQKQLLSDTGAKTLADLVDLGNANWKDYPKGFASVKGLGSAAIAKLVAQLPSTAPAVVAQPGELPPTTKKIKLMTFGGADENLQSGDVYEATVRDDGVAIISLPGKDPVEFQTYEYELVS